MKRSLHISEETKAKIVASAKPDPSKVHVLPRSGGWAVKREGAKKAIRVVKSKTRAGDIAHKMVEEGKFSSVVIHRKDGTFQRGA